MHLTIVQTMSCTTERGFKCGATSGCSGETFFVSDISQARSFSYLYVLQWISFPSNGRMFIPPSPSSRHVCFICFLAYERVTWEVFWVGLLVKPPTRHRNRIHHTDCCWRVEITKHYSFRNGHFTVLRSFKMNGGNQDFYEILEHRDNLWESWLVGLGQGSPTQCPRATRRPHDPFNAPAKHAPKILLLHRQILSFLWCEDNFSLLSMMP